MLPNYSRYSIPNIQILMSGLSSVTLVIQARVASTRLPRKCFAQISGCTMIERVFMQCKGANLPQDIVLTTSNADDNKDLLSIAIQNNIYTSTGPLDDIIKRLCNASGVCPSHHVVRVWGDCPLICPQLIDASIQSHLTKKAMFTMTDTFHSLPKGQDLEIYDARFLKMLDKVLPPDSSYRIFPRECINLYLNDSQINLYKDNYSRSDINLTVDYAQDLAYVKSILSAADAISRPVTLPDILNVLSNSSVIMNSVNQDLPRNIEYQNFISKENA